MVFPPAEEYLIRRMRREVRDFEENTCLLLDAAHISVIRKAVIYWKEEILNGEKKRTLKGSFTIFIVLNKRYYDHYNELIS